MASGSVHPDRGFDTCQAPSYIYTCNLHQTTKHKHCPPCTVRNLWSKPGEAKWFVWGYTVVCGIHTLIYLTLSQVLAPQNQKHTFFKGESGLLSGSDLNSCIMKGTEVWCCIVNGQGLILPKQGLFNKSREQLAYGIGCQYIWECQAEQPWPEAIPLSSYPVGDEQQSGLAGTKYICFYFYALWMSEQWNWWVMLSLSSGQRTPLSKIPPVLYSRKTTGFKVRCLGFTLDLSFTCCGNRAAPLDSTDSVFLLTKTFHTLVWWSIVRVYLKVI